MSVQAFTYSICCEAHEVKRLVRKETVGADANNSTSASVKQLLSKYGIEGLACNDSLIILPNPSAYKDDGCQPFDGRLGRLRYFGLAVMAAAGAVSADLVHLVLGFPLTRETGEEASVLPPREGESPHRAPVAFPILYGHVLSHVVAALCATCGRGRARSDSLDLVWPVPFSRKGSFYGVPQENPGLSADTVTQDCDGFIKLGLLARVLQVLLGKMQIEAGSKSVGRRVLVIKSIRQLVSQGRLATADDENEWQLGCYHLLEAALSDANLGINVSETYGSEALSRFQDACKVACDAAVSYLSEIGTIYQVLVPGVVLRHQDRKRSGASGSTPALGTFKMLCEEFGLEDIGSMMKFNVVRHVVSTWFTAACVHANKAETANPSDTGRGIVQRRLYQTEGFRVYDWPLDSCRRVVGTDVQDSEKKIAATAAAAEPQDDSMPMDLDSHPAHMLAARAGLHRKSSLPLVAFTARKSVPFLGGFVEERNLPLVSSTRPRIGMLPTSYTDLYAELGAICPESEQTALCLICGEVLNANGKGECTKHASKCGAGSCVFFLLQECQGLLMHGGKAVYVQSPYVDSHGETPQYRGRPLNLDLDRFEIFRELWTGHTIRQKVIQERGSARQVIIADFY